QLLLRPESPSHVLPRISSLAHRSSGLDVHSPCQRFGLTLPRLGASDQIPVRTAQPVPASMPRSSPCTRRRRSPHLTSATPAQGANWRGGHPPTNRADLSTC